VATRHVTEHLDARGNHETEGEGNLQHEQRRVSLCRMVVLICVYTYKYNLDNL